MGSLVVHIFCKLEKLGIWFSCGWRHNGGTFTHFGWGHQALGIKPMTQFFDSKFYWKLAYKSLEPLICFLAFLDLKLWF